MKISIIMPSYNDANSIIETLQSVIKQTYKNWELIIVDDGSEDNTKEIIKNYKIKYDKEDKIRYLYQKNSDQLNAIKNGCKYITGDYVYILHSDDLLNGKDILNKVVQYLSKHPNLDGIIADMITIDKDSNITGIIKLSKFNGQKYILPLQLLWMGRNLYGDVAFHKKNTFIKTVYNNYLNWNGPFWLNLDEMNLLNIKKVDFPFFKYRIYDGNYINNEIGKLNVTNGELRVVTRLLKSYSIPFYRFQYVIFRLFSKLKLSQYYRPLYFNKETKNKAKIIDFILHKRFTDEEIKKYIFLDSLINFYQNYHNKTINILKINDNEKIYMGSDMRLFNKNLINNSLSPLYKNILKEMAIGFNEIMVDKEDVEKVTNIIKFLCIYPYVKVSIKQGEE